MNKIIYQFHLLSNGEIKISSAIYKESIDYKGVPCYKKEKIINKKINKPLFPKIIYKLGRLQYNKYYSFNELDKTKFANEILQEIKNQIEILEYQMKNLIIKENVIVKYLK